MSGETAIQWTHPPGYRGATWNPVVGCRHASPGCLNCYAEVMARRIATMGTKPSVRYLQVVKKDAAGAPRAAWNGDFVTVPELLTAPMETRTPTCWFVNSMSDLFGEGVSDEYIAAVFAIMAATPHHRYQILTKRSERLPGWFEWVAKNGFNHANVGNVLGSCARAELYKIADELGRNFDNPTARWPLENVHLGVSVENQEWANKRVGDLIRAPAVVRFLSIEPQLGPVDVDEAVERVTGTRQYGCDGAHRGSGQPGCPKDLHHHHDSRCRFPIDWVIVGGESGSGARGFQVKWIRDILEQCHGHGVPVFVKQLGAVPLMDESEWREMDPRPRLARHDVDGAPAGMVTLRLRDHAKGGDMEEWPLDLHVREFPTV